MTTNKPMTGEQLDELMAVAVRMQRDTEVARDFPSANFAYAVQVAVLELRRTRDTNAALAAENASLKQFPEQIIGFIGKLGTSEMGSSTREAIESAAKRIKNPATDAFLAEVRAQGVEMFADYCATANNGHEINPDAEEIRDFAAQLRQDANTAELVAAGIITKVGE
ncbi:hypothetical protein [Leclercia adecarboxylata]|uniref:hypothetical protein n=1 Tax=Leclercia adecarboxylata TaxID=83655 RepID=UPI002B2EC753|nr:hypothetical protein NRF19_18860 [Leclercia adecarboxylata]